MTKKYAFINLFRSIAAFWVLTAHCMIWGAWNGIQLPSAKIAVDLFMVISGYLMAANTFVRIELEPLTTAKDWFRFWLRRFFRLAPAYYLSLAIAVFTSNYFLGGYKELQNLNPSLWPAGGVYDPRTVEYTFVNIILHLSFLFGLSPVYSFSTFLPDWSLSLEMQFYFVFPGLILLMRKFGYLEISIFVGLPVFFVGLGVSHFIPFSEPSLLCMKFNYFLAGILLFQSTNVIIDTKKRLVLLMYATLLCLIDYKYGKQMLILPLILIIMIFLSRLESIDRTPNWIFIFINSKFILLTSDISYGIYLFHGFFVSIFGLVLKTNILLLTLPSQQRFFVMLLFVMASTCVTAYLIHRFVEIPGIRFGTHFIRKFLPIKTHIYNEDIVSKQAVKPQ